jgi:hypothetical protein
VFDYTSEDYDKYPHVAGKVIIQICGEWYDETKTA